MKEDKKAYLQDITEEDIKNNEEYKELYEMYQEILKKEEDKKNGLQ